MARQNRRNRRRRSGPAGLPGMPSQEQLQAQAMALAQAAVPTLGSINRQFKRSEGDMAGFTKSLVSLLKAGPGQTADAYDAGINQQRGWNEAAADRLGDVVGPDYSQGAESTLAARGTSALSDMVQRRANAQRYEGRLPGFAAGRGWQQLAGLEQQRRDAVANRSDALRSAFTQSYQQVYQNAQSMALNLQQLGLQRADLTERRHEYQLNYQLQVSQYQEGVRQFNASMAQRQAEQKLANQQFYDGLGVKVAADRAKAASQARKYSLGGFTRWQVHQMQQDAVKVVEGAVNGIPNPGYGKPNGQSPDKRWLLPPNAGYGKHGWDMTAVFKHLVKNDVPAQVALAVMQQTYSPDDFSRWQIDTGIGRRRNAYLDNPDSTLH